MSLNPLGQSAYNAKTERQRAEVRRWSAEWWLRVFWPTLAVGFVLQMTDDILDPSGHLWQVATALPALLMIVFLVGWLTQRSREIIALEGGWHALRSPWLPVVGVVGATVVIAALLTLLFSRAFS